MMKDQYKLWTIVFIILASGIATSLIPAEAADYTPVLRVSTDNVYLTAGIENQIKITLTNVGSWNIYEAKIAISVPSTSPGISIVDGGHKVYNKIGDDEKRTFYVRVYVDEETPLGAYTLTLQTTYMKKVQYGTEMLESSTLQLGIVVDKAIRSDTMMTAEAENPLITAGVDNPLNLTLGNIGNETLYDIDATLTSSSPYLVILEGARFTHGTLRVNHSVQHPVTLRVSREAPLGGYTLTETIFYEDVDGQTSSETFIVGVDVRFSSKPNPILDIVIDDPHLTAGSENSVNVNLTNLGDEGLQDIDVSLTSTSPYIAFLEGGRITLNSLSKGEGTSSEAVIAVSKSAPVGVYTFTASAYYRGSDGQDYIETYTLGVRVDSVSVPRQTSVVLRSYQTSLETVRPGDRFQLDLDFECLGAAAHEVKAVLALDPLTGISTMSPTTLSLGDLEPDQRVEAIYELLVGGAVQAGQYPAVVSIIYLDADGVPKSLTETVTLSVRGIVEFKLINVEPLDMPIGTRTEFEADLLLIGTENIEFVNIEVMEDPVFRRTLDSGEYIGAVDPDSPIPFDLWVEVAGGTELGEYVLRLKIEYTDDLNREHEATLEVPMDVTERALEGGSQASGWDIWALIRRLLGLGP
ncbi:MAG: hypothetical protein PVJ38_02615 [Candidatus Bathyarchaeota archaeon]|jgi:hypothetical protein